MRVLTLLLLSFAAHAATIQMTLDAFKFSPPGTNWGIQLKSIGSTQSFKITNIKLTNLTLQLSTSAFISGTVASGITLNDTDLQQSDMYISDVLNLIKDHGGEASMLSFDVYDAVTGLPVSPDAFSLFIYGPPPASSDSLFGNESFGSLIVDNPTNTSGSSGSSGTTGIIDPIPQVPEPSTFCMLALPLAALALTRRGKR